MVKYYAIYPILFIVPPNFTFAFLSSAGYGAAQNDATVFFSNSDRVKPVKGMNSRSSCKAMKNASKQAAGFCPWCNSFAVQNKCLTSQRFKCGRLLWGGRSTGSGVGVRRACSSLAAACAQPLLWVSSLSCQTDIKQH